MHDITQFFSPSSSIRRKDSSKFPHLENFEAREAQHILAATMNFLARSHTDLSEMGGRSERHQKSPEAATRGDHHVEAEEDWWW